MTALCMSKGLNRADSAAYSCFFLQFARHLRPSPAEYVRRRPIAAGSPKLQSVRGYEPPVHWPRWH